jgi:GNAT superfamily N-acetyltransferase
MNAVRSIDAALSHGVDREVYEVHSREATMLGDSLTLRRAIPSDAPTITEFNRLLALESEQTVLDPATLAAGVAAGLADANKGLYFVAEENGQLLGQLMITREWSDWRNGWIWWIQSVYVRGDARKRGIFRALYEHIHGAAVADRHVIGIRLYVKKENHAAQQVYTRMGMEWSGYLVYERVPLLPGGGA